MSVMNKEELSELILQNQKEMYVLAYSILQNQSDAQDAVSECIVRAFENRTSLRKRASARSWLIKILINVSRSAITKRQKVVLFADPEQYEQASEEPEDYLWSAILELQENVRVVMVLYYYDGFSVREISAMLDIPEGTTKTRLSAGRKKEADITDSADDVIEISQEEVVEKASALLERLYGVNADTLTTETEHDQASDGNGEIFSTDHITYRDETAGISYLVSVNLQNGEIRTVSAQKDTGSNYSKEIAEDAVQYQEFFSEAEKMAHAYMGENAAWTEKQIEYMRDEKQMLGTGIVNYIFATDTDACVISYSCAQQYFYQVREFSKDELDSYLSDEKEQGAMRNLEQVITEVK